MTALRKVLVVDDDPAVRKSFDRVLTGKGYAVITAENGEEALRKLNEEKYDLVYSDIRMPGMSGLEVAEKVRARRPWTPVVIITGYGTDIAEERAKAAGVSKFLHKPLSPAMIEDSARDVLAVPAAPVADRLSRPPPKRLWQRSRPREACWETSYSSLPRPLSAWLTSWPCRSTASPWSPFWRAAPPRKNETVKAAAIVLKHVAMVVAAPFVGLAYVVLFPFIGLALLLWMAGKAMAAKLRLNAADWA